MKNIVLSLLWIERQLCHLEKWKLCFRKFNGDGWVGALQHVLLNNHHQHPGLSFLWVEPKMSESSWKSNVIHVKQLVSCTQEDWKYCLSFLKINHVCAELSFYTNVHFLSVFWHIHLGIGDPISLINRRQFWWYLRCYLTFQEFCMMFSSVVGWWEFLHVSPSIIFIQYPIPTISHLSMTPIIWRLSVFL